MSKTYVEKFDDGPGGWFGFINNFEGPKKLERRPSAVMSRSPWWIDYNHAPPGAGYLNLLFMLMTKGPGFSEAMMAAGGPNRFVDEGYSTNFTNARCTFRMQGELEGRGANLVLLIQSSFNGLTSGWACTGQPLTVTKDWSDQVVTCSPDPKQWTCLGSRHDRTKTYGEIELKTVLGDVNTDILLVMFGVHAVPLGPIDGDPHRLRAGTDYPVWHSKLPEGYVIMDEVRIEYA